VPAPVRAGAPACCPRAAVARRGRNGRRRHRSPATGRRRRRRPQHPERFARGRRQVDSQRLARAGARRFDDRRHGTIGSELRRSADDGDHGFQGCVPHERGQHRAIGRRVGAGECQIDQGRRADRDALLAQPAAHRVRWGRDLDTQLAQAVHHHPAAAAGGGDHRHAAPLHRAPAGEHRRDVQQRVQHVDLHDTDIAQERAHGRAPAGERAGVRRRELLAHLRAAGGEGDHRLAGLPCAPHHGFEAARLPHRLEEQQDRIGVFVVDQKLAQFTHGQVRFVAAGHQPGEAHPPSLPLREQRAHHPSALRDHAVTARQQLRERQHLGGGQGHPVDEVDEPQAVGAEHAHAVRARRGDQPRLACLPLRARFAEAVAQDGDAGDPRLTTGHDRLLHMRGRQQDDRVVDRAAHLADGGVGTFAADLAAVRIDGVQLPAKTVPRR